MNGTRFLTSALRTPAALGYLALVAAVVAWVGLDTLFVEHADASLAGVWIFVVTAPTSFLFLALPGPLPWIGVAVGALVQAVALGALYRGVTGRRTASHA